MTNFKVGDKVRLTGTAWAENGYAEEGDEVIITQVYPDGEAWFNHNGDAWVIGDEYTAELVERSTTPASADDIAKIAELAEKLGIADDPVNHPSHYTQFRVEVIELTRDMPFLTGNVVKYVTRAPFKGEELEDLKKARWYIDRAIEDVEEREPK